MQVGQCRTDGLRHLERVVLDPIGSGAKRADPRERFRDRRAATIERDRAARMPTLVDRDDDGRRRGARIEIVRQRPQLADEPGKISRGHHVTRRAYYATPATY